MSRARVFLLLSCLAGSAGGCSETPRKDHPDSDDAAREDETESGSDGGADRDRSEAGQEPDSDGATSAGAPDAEAGAAADGGRAAEAGASDGGVQDDAATLGPSLFGVGPPYTNPAKPVHRLAVVDSGSRCVVLADRTLFCPYGSTMATIASQNHDVRSIVFPGVSDIREYTLVRNDGSSYSFGPSNGFESAYRLDGAGYVAAQSWISSYCGLKTAGTVHCVGAPWPITLPQGPFVTLAGSPVDARFNGLRVDGVVILATMSGTTTIANTRFTSFDAGRVYEGCGEATDGSLHCYELDGGRVTKHWPQPQRDLRDYTYGRGDVCVVQSDGRAACQKFDGSASTAVVPQDKRFVDIEMASATACCGVTEAGELWCWNDSAAGTKQIALPMPAALN